MLPSIQVLLNCNYSAHIRRKKKALHSQCFYSNWQHPTLPGRLQPSTIGLWMLNYCVRNGNRWVHSGIVTRYTIGSIYPQPSTSANHTSLSLVFLGCFGMGHITASISPFGSFHRCASKTKQKHRRLLPIILRFRSYSWEVLVWNTLAVQFALQLISPMYFHKTTS